MNPTVKIQTKQLRILQSLTYFPKFYGSRCKLNEYSETMPIASLKSQPLQSMQSSDNIRYGERKSKSRIDKITADKLINDIMGNSSSDTDENLKQTNK